MAKKPSAKTGGASGSFGAFGLIVDTEHTGPGRPTSYRTQYAKQATQLCKLGAIDLDLAQFFEIDISTLHRWKHAHPKFAEALAIGKEQADANVERALYSRAVGYSHDSVKVVTTKEDVHKVAIIEHYAPDVTAQIFWLKNRQRKEWRADPTNVTPDPVDLLALVRADAPRMGGDEPGPENPIL